MRTSSMPLWTNYEADHLIRCAFIETLVYGVTKAAELNLGLRNVVVMNIELLKKLLEVLERGGTAVYSMANLLQTEVIPDVMNNFEKGCKDAFYKQYLKQVSVGEIDIVLED